MPGNQNEVEFLRAVLALTDDKNVIVAVQNRLVELVDPDEEIARLCKTCGGQGAVETGIAEYGATLCEQCEGTGMSNG